MVYFGDHGNLRGIAKRLGNLCCYLPDLINHGNSPHRKESTLEQIAHDIYETFFPQLPATILGHSMGAKVAMVFAHYYPQLCNSLICLDMLNRDFPPGRQDNNFEQIKKLEGKRFSSRAEAEKIIEPYITEKALRGFLLKNIVFKDGYYLLRIKTDNLLYDQSLLVKRLNLKILKIPALFLMAENGYSRPDDSEYIEQQYINSTHKVLANCGHWLHGEKPKEVVSEIKQFLSKTNARGVQL